MQRLPLNCVPLFTPVHRIVHRLAIGSSEVPSVTDPVVADDADDPVVVADVVADDDDNDYETDGEWFDNGHHDNLGDDDDSGGYEADDEWFDDNGHHDNLGYDDEVQLDLPHQEFNMENGDALDSVVCNQITPDLDALDSVVCNTLDLVNPDEILESNNNVSERVYIEDDELDDNDHFNYFGLDENGYDANDEWSDSEDDHGGYLDGDDV